jgi:hypothetical protein
MSGVMNTPDAQYVPQAIELMKSEPARGFRIEVASDSLVEMDEASEKASRTEFMTAFGAVMRESLPMVQAAPEMGNLIGEVLMFVIRTFKGGRQLENVLEQTIAQLNQPKEPQQGPSPEEMQMQAQMQAEQAQAQMTMQIEQAKIQAQAQIEQMKSQERLRIAEMTAMAEIEKARILANIQGQAEIEKATQTATIEAATDIQIAQMDATNPEVPNV